MNKVEVAGLLTVVVSLDRRKVGHADVEGWLGTLGDLRFEECRDAAVKHYKTSTDWLMPAHIRRLVISTRQDVAMKALPAGAAGGVSRPEWVTRKAQESKDAQRLVNAQRKDTGLPPFYGKTVMSDTDGRPGW